MKLYLHAVLLIAMSSSVINIHSMEPDEDNTQIEQLQLQAKNILENVKYDETGSDWKSILSTCIEKNIISVSHALHSRIGKDLVIKENQDDFAVVKFLLTQGANPNFGLQQIFERTATTGLLDDRHKKLCRICIFAGGNLPQLEKKPLELNYLSPQATLPYEEGAYCKITLSQLADYVFSSAQARNSLFAMVIKPTIITKTGISFQNNINDKSRRHIKDTDGNNLLYYALLHNNATVANRLFYLWPTMLWEKNFKNRAIIDGGEALKNFAKICLNDNTPKPVKVAFKHLSKQVPYRSRLSQLFKSK